MDTEFLWERARIIRAVRAFFDSRGYLEADTPLLSPDLIPESCLEVFETRLIRPGGAGQDAGTTEKPLWLIPSPEIWMKKLIARHRVSMYQICRCFRNGEQQGRLHSPEFTMLEYYTMDAGYLDSLSLTEALIAGLLPAGQLPAGQSLPFLRITMEEAFGRWAGFSLAEVSAAGAPAMEEQARRLGLDPPAGLGVAALYDLIFIHAVEPELPKDRFTALLDYPAFVPCLAKTKQPAQQACGSGRVLAQQAPETQGRQAQTPGRVLAQQAPETAAAAAAQSLLCKERWELYYGGVELANCYSEETDPDEVRRFFRAEAAEKEHSALVKHAVDSDYWRIFAATGGFPRCSGVALGLDRLIMALTGKKDINGVLPFAEY